MMIAWLISFRFNFKPNFILQPNLFPVTFLIGEKSELYYYEMSKPTLIRDHRHI